MKSDVQHSLLASEKRLSRPVTDVYDAATVGNAVSCLLKREMQIAIGIPAIGEDGR
jgi:hypothetical protein